MIPSSKIETRDLSPQVLGGVAQEESVQEVLNKLDNVAQQEDVQEILEKVNLITEPQASILQGVFVNGTMSDKTILNINGKGIFKGAALTDVSDSSTYSSIEIIVDGVSYNCSARSSSGSGNRIHLLFAPENEIKLYANSNYVYRKIYSATFDTNNGTDVIGTMNQSTSLLSNRSCAVWFLAAAGISFQESLIVKVKAVTTTASSNGAYAWYTLEE